MLRPPKEEIVFGRKPKTKHFKELLEIRGDPGKFNVSGIKGEENFKKEMVDLQHLLLWRSKGEWRPGAFLKWVVTTCSHTLLMCMLNYRMQFKNRAPYLIKCIVELWNFKEMLKLHKHVKLPFFEYLLLWTALFNLLILNSFLPSYMLVFICCCFLIKTCCILLLHNYIHDLPLRWDFYFSTTCKTVVTRISLTPVLVLTKFILCMP